MKLRYLVPDKRSRVGQKKLFFVSLTSLLLSELIYDDDDVRIDLLFLLDEWAPTDEGEGGSDGDINAGKSTVFAVLEICLCVLVRHVPAIHPSFRYHCMSLS